MDLASIIGLVVCIGMVIFGIATGPEGFLGLKNFLDPASALITFGGMFASTMIFSSVADFLNALKAFKIALKTPEINEAEVINQIIDLSNVARKEGLLALEEAANNLEDDFMKKGILLVVDGTDPELVKSIMETEIACVDGRHKQVIGVYTNLAAMGPAWGMIGTLIGLINMLKQLDDISMVGPNMAVALITTLYGSMAANWICTPIAGKLKYNSDKEIMMKECMLEGLLSIQAGENPRIIEEKLKSFLSPAQRSEMGSNEDLGGE
jgi:chemotaxis protein MotA